MSHCLKSRLEDFKGKRGYQSVPHQNKSSQLSITPLSNHLMTLGLFSKNNSTSGLDIITTQPLPDFLRGNPPPQVLLHELEGQPLPIHQDYHLVVTRQPFLVQPSDQPELLNYQLEYHPLVYCADFLSVGTLWELEKIPELKADVEKRRQKPGMPVSLQDLLTIHFERNPDIKQERLAWLFTNKRWFWSLYDLALTTYQHYGIDKWIDYFEMVIKEYQFKKIPLYELQQLIQSWLEESIKISLEDRGVFGASNFREFLTNPFEQEHGIIPYESAYFEKKPFGQQLKEMEKHMRFTILNTLNYPHTADPYYFKNIFIYLFDGYSSVNEFLFFGQLLIQTTSLPTISNQIQDRWKRSKWEKISPNFHFVTSPSQMDYAAYPDAILLCLCLDMDCPYRLKLSSHSKDTWGRLMKIHPDYAMGLLIPFQLFDYIEGLFEETKSIGDFYELYNRWERKTRYCLHFFKTKGHSQETSTTDRAIYRHWWKPLFDHYLYIKEQYLSKYVAKNRSVAAISSSSSSSSTNPYDFVASQ